MSGAAASPDGKGGPGMYAATAPGDGLVLCTEETKVRAPILWQNNPPPYLGMKRDLGT